MIRLLVVSAIVGLVGFCLGRAPVQKQEDLSALQQKRIELLDQRVSLIQGLVDSGRASASELIRPGMDVINARLDYADSNSQRKELLGELLGEYDKLIEIAEFRASEPPPAAAGNRRQASTSESEVLFLKSERIRVQIILESAE